VTIKLPKSAKPRNPLVAPARNRKAGAHGSYNPARSKRRIEKYQLSLLLAGKKSEEDYDA